MEVKIGDYAWKVEFVSKTDERLSVRNADGVTLYNDMLILVREDLNDVIKRECVIHELVHATLFIQGRCFQKKFDLEEVCELFGFCADKIVELADEVMNNGRN